MKDILISHVIGHEGECVPIWLNTNLVCFRTNPTEIRATGFFKNIKWGRFLGLTWIREVGKDFWGYIYSEDFEVYQTDYKYIKNLLLSSEEE